MPGTESSALHRAVTELERSVDDAALGAVIERWRSPLRVAVAGRPGAGKSRVVTALDLPGTAEVHGVDALDLPRPVLDHDVLALVVARTVTAADLEVVAARSSGFETLVVLGRTDLPIDADAVAAALPAGTTVIGADDVDTLARVWATAVSHAANRRDIDLLVAMEDMAARRPHARSSVETFLRAPAAAHVRRGARA
ncbi:hypothetical protein HQ325_12155 [Rhodococcus sp. BP-349]|uniref:hypothetical protein n=1 Tax=unclassified Rhodococcus (in: high G+C Gram-positive bacteria) TaxID=192944 RepID=UPI001C9BB41C|nr:MULTISPECIES: hypothetical protein [unclassified Rhodococcus (in: high G+C Gram-positive bacteria)]MBY6539427.1 hypothetical protein [Rhodococcus sp. BP-363]MBY6544245.1 hypothetical protein [Rhodococcus sp. BP-369]MBY6563475.1 hypothetical protein [Rhodococcus sp. BP-370]MBY6577767.1 hypothetical protein [Rhodococcus sp. BP-364]MBY6587068.1 hypothetical protein [Rhodococcus sp. BP-358]